MMKQIGITLLSFSTALITSLPSVSWAQSNHGLYPSTQNQFAHSPTILSPSRSTPDPIPNVKVDGSPALAWFQGKFYLAYKGMNNKNIYYTTCSIHCRNGNNWSPEQIENPDGPGYDATTESPALVVFNKRLYLVHKGADNNNYIYYTSTSDGVKWANEQMVMAYSYGNTGRMATMSGIPALAVFNGKLYVAHKGSADSHIYYTSTSDGTTWAQEKIANPDGYDTTTESPALAAFNNRLYLVHKGADNNSIYYTSSPDGTSWTPEKTFPLDPMLGMPALATYSGSDGNYLFIAFRGADKESPLWVNKGEMYDNDISWSLPEFMDDYISNSPAITTRDTDDYSDFYIAYVKKNGDVFFQ